jgi:hypothetical protein|tara:strand:- start:169 stop:342 length:174 start_codon:yes stop_codon:yes gene_type:complete
LFFSVFHEWTGEISGKMFGVPKEQAKATFFHVFQQYRLVLVTLNIVPFLALAAMASA